MYVYMYTRTIPWYVIFQMMSWLQSLGTLSLPATSVHSIVSQILCQTGKTLILAIDGNHRDIESTWCMMYTLCLSKKILTTCTKAGDHQGMYRGRVHIIHVYANLHTCWRVEQKILTQCSIKPVGIRFAGRSESLRSSLMVPIAFARLYTTFALPHDFKCCIAAAASSKKSSGTFTLKFDAKCDLNRLEIICNCWFGVVSNECCNSGTIFISLSVIFTWLSVICLGGK